MKATLIAFFIMIGVITAHSATYDNVGRGAKSSSNSPESQINQRINKTDKLNNINKNMNKYRNSDNPADVNEFNRYQLEKNKETFKK